MKQFTPLHVHQQEKVKSYFQSEAEISYWKDVYTIDNVKAQIIRERHTAVLALVKSLALAPGSRVLEIGCGAGFMAVALAQHGFCVHAMDSVESMVEVARHHAAEAEVTELLSVDVGNVYSLACEDEFFDLVIAVGVIPWLEHPERAIQEMARVTKPGGHVILTSANRAALASFLDPWWNPLCEPLKWRLKTILERAGRRSPSPDMVTHSCRFIDKTLARTQFVKTRGLTLGFGPFSFLRRTILPEPLGTTLHRRLQRLADRNVPVFRSTGMAYIVLARKLASQ